MDRNIVTLSLEVPKDMKKDIQTAVRNLHYHTASELIRTGIKKVLEEVKVKNQVGELTGNAQVK